MQGPVALHGEFKGCIPVAACSQGKLEGCLSAGHHQGSSACPTTLHSPQDRLPVHLILCTTLRATVAHCIPRFNQSLLLRPPCGHLPQVCDIPTSRPGLCRAEIVGWGLAPHIWYPPSELRTVLQDLLSAAAAQPALAACSAFRYDVVDVTRELLSKAAGLIWAAVVGAYLRHDTGSLTGAAAALGALLDDMERLLNCHEGFMLGPAIARARAYAREGEWGVDEGRRQQLEVLYEWNLRTQVSSRGRLGSGQGSVVSSNSLAGRVDSRLTCSEVGCMGATEGSD